MDHKSTHTCGLHSGNLKVYPSSTALNVLIAPGIFTAHVLFDRLQLAWLLIVLIASCTVKIWNSRGVRPGSLTRPKYVKALKGAYLVFHEFAGARSRARKSHKLTRMSCKASLPHQNALSVVTAERHQTVNLAPKR